MSILFCLLIFVLSIHSTNNGQGRHAAPRDQNAPPADEQEVRGVDNPPQVLGHMGSVVANAVGSFAYGVRQAFRLPASWWAFPVYVIYTLANVDGLRFRRVSPLGQ